MKLPLPAKAGHQCIRCPLFIKDAKLLYIVHEPFNRARVNAFPDKIHFHTASSFQPRHFKRRRLNQIKAPVQQKWSTDDASTRGGGLSRTALHELHVEHGGTMVPFGGFSMPVQYSDLSVGESHKWTREKTSLFDVGHMYIVIHISAYS